MFGNKEKIFLLGVGSNILIKDEGFDEHDIWDISAVASFYNMSNRMASALDLMPNTGYHQKAR